MSTQTDNPLAQLRQLTTVVADTGDLSAIARLRPVDATTNPSLITAAAKLPESQALLQQAYDDAQAEGLRDAALIERMIDLLTVRLGVQILALIAGRVSTEVDAALSYDSAATIAKAQQLIDLYRQNGIEQTRVLIKMAATWQGIAAAEQLEQQGIHCNLTLLFGMHQAIACAEAGVTLISPFVGRILDWQKKNEGRTEIAIAQDSGVISVKNIYHYYKQHGYATEVMGASFRSIAQIRALAGCDLLTIAPSLLDELAASDTPITAQLSAQPSNALTPQTKPTRMTAAQFEQQHAADAMSSELLEAGIAGFVAAREQLAAMLRAQFLD